MISVYEDFVKDYNNPNITGEDVKRYNKLNARQYSCLRAEALHNGDISTPRHMNSTGAKFYTKTKNGEFIVKKQYGHKTTVVGRFGDEVTAQMIVALCKTFNWDLNQITNVIDEYKVKPKNYSKVNGYFIVEKRINGERVVFYRFKQEAHAIHMVNELRKYDWDISKVDLILYEMGLN
ncbi:MAG: hypothetical protein IJH63_03295 [Methanobrevibacter sp.]|nr:hypothetical protein [Methanobrevibacter sp.]